MTAYATPDLESFQKLLANAFVVLQSDRYQVALRHNRTPTVDRGGRPRRGWGHASDRPVCSKRRQRYWNRHRPAEASAEILCVENAQADSRIEGAVCRQFGAESLLILPIYRDRAVVGVLEVLFDHAHVFQHREVRSYRLMAGLVGDVMSHAVRREHKKVLAADPSTMQQMGQIRPQVQKSLNDSGSLPALTTNRAICKACGSPFAEAGKQPALRQSAWPASKRAKGVSFYKSRWKTAVAVAAVLVIARWIAYKENRPSTSPLGTSALRAPNAIEQPTPWMAEKRVSASSTSNPRTGVGTKEDGNRAARTMPHWVRVGNNELDYVAQDVTVRYFTAQRALQPVRNKDNQVRYISEDVTVRYFRQSMRLRRPIALETPRNRWTASCIRVARFRRGL
jgi:hypothetical protein